MLEKVDKKSLLYLIVFIIIILVFVGFFYYRSKDELEEVLEEKELPWNLQEDIIKSLTVPAEQSEPELLPQDVIKDLTVPK